MPTMPRNDHHTAGQSNTALIDQFIRSYPRLARHRGEHDALLLALARRIPGEVASARAIAQLRDGIAAARVAASLGVAPWLQILPVDGLTDDLILQPMSAAFAAFMREQPLLPSSRTGMARLLLGLRIANTCGGEVAARELAPHILAGDTALTPQDIALIALYLQAEADPSLPAHRFIAAQPTDRSLAALARATFSWLTLLLLAVQYGPQGAPTWRRDGRFRSHDLTAVLTSEHLVDAARAGRPDLAHYAPYYILDLVRLFALAEAGVDQGHAELRLGGRHGDELQMTRIDAPGLRRLDLRARCAIYAMLAEDPPVGSLGEPDPAAPHLDAAMLRQAWRDLMGPQITARHGNPCVPPQLTPEAFIKLLRAAFHLAHRAHLDAIVRDAEHAFDQRYPTVVMPAPRQRVRAT